jgi:hypothetical protein
MGLLFSPWFWLACAVTLTGAYAGGRLQQHEHDAVELATLKAQWKGQRDAVINDWASGVGRIAKLETENESLRLAAFTPVEKAAADLPAVVRSVRVPAAAVSVLNRAVAAASRTRPTAKAPRAVAPVAPDPHGAEEGDRPVDSAAPADSAGESNVGALTDWGVIAAKLYGGCLDRVDALTRAYDNIREPTLKQ